MQPALKKGNEDEAIGRSRGGLSTKISIAVDALGNPVRFILTAGQVADICQAEGLIDGVSFEKPARRQELRRRSFSSLYCRQGRSGHYSIKPLSLASHP
jgi:hypothetical protein